MSVTEEQMLVRTEERLTNLGKDTKTTDDTEVAEVEPTPAEESTPVESGTEIVSEAEPVVAPDAITSSDKELPDTFRRAAIHQGWTGPEIDEFYKANPTLAVKTLGKIHDSTNKLSSQFATAGRQVMQPSPTPTQPTPASAPTSTSSFKGIDLKAIREEYGDDPIVETVSKLNDALVQLTQTTAPASHAANAPALTTRVHSIDPQASVQAEVTELIGGQIDQFFAMPVMQDKEFYGQGRTWDKLSKEQVANRMEMLKEADHIKAGAALHGVRVTNSEAMERAHILRTSAIQAKDIREGIKSTLSKRQNNMTIEPGRSIPITEKKGPLNTDQILARAEQRLKKVFK